MNLDEVSVVIGMDWADRTHGCCLFDQAQGTRKVIQVGSSPEDFGAWLDAVQTQYPQGRIVIALERPEGAMVEMIRDQSRFEIVPVNPIVLHRFRQAFAPSGAKNDPGDAALIGEIVLTHPDKFETLMNQDPVLAALSVLVKERRHWVDTRTGLLEELISVLKKYYPQALELAGENLTSPMAREFLLRWPDLLVAKKANWSTLEKFYRHHHSGREEVLLRRRELLQTTRSVSEHQAYLQPCRLHMQAIVRQIEAASISITQFDTAIDELYSQASGRDVIDSLPGAGAALAPRLWVACALAGQNPSAEDMQLTSGIAPVQIQSGNSKVVRFRWARPKFLHQTWVEFAHHSVQYSAWANEYYRRHKDKGHGEGAILRGLAFKWIRIVARLWRDQRPYDESFYLQHCSARMAAA